MAKQAKPLQERMMAHVRVEPDKRRRCRVCRRAYEQARALTVKP